MSHISRSFCFFLVPVYDRGRYGIYSWTPFDDDDDDDDLQVLSATVYELSICLHLPTLYTILVSRSSSELYVGLLLPLHMASLAVQLLSGFLELEAAEPGVQVPQKVSFHVQPRGLEL